MGDPPRHAKAALKFNLKEEVKAAQRSMPHLPPACWYFNDDDERPPPALSGLLDRLQDRRPSGEPTLYQAGEVDYEAAFPECSLAGDLDITFQHGKAEYWELTHAREAYAMVEASHLFDVGELDKIRQPPLRDRFKRSYGAAHIGNSSNGLCALLSLNNPDEWLGFASITFKMIPREKTLELALGLQDLYIRPGCDRENLDNLFAFMMGRAYSQAIDYQSNRERWAEHFSHRIAHVMEPNRTSRIADAQQECFQRAVFFVLCPTNTPRIDGKFFEIPRLYPLSPEECL